MFPQEAILQCLCKAPKRPTFSRQSPTFLVAPTEVSADEEQEAPGARREAPPSFVAKAAELTVGQTVDQHRRLRVPSVGTSASENLPSVGLMLAILHCRKERLGHEQRECVVLHAVLASGHSMNFTVRCE